MELRRRHRDGARRQPLAQPYAAAGSYIARHLTASTTGADVVVAKVRVDVACRLPPPLVVAAPIAPSRPSTRARGSSLGKPLVTHGCFDIRGNFTADARRHGDHRGVPRQKKIATASTTARRNGSKRVTVSCPRPAGSCCAESKSKRLKVTARVRVKRHVLQTRKLTIRR